MRMERSSERKTRGVLIDFKELTTVHIPRLVILTNDSFSFTGGAVQIGYKSV